MNLYRKSHNQFFLACAYARKDYFIAVLSEEHIMSGKWATKDEIEDFTLAYMAGGEL